MTREQLERLARDTFAEAARIDAAEDARYGADRRGDEPAEGWEPGPGRAEKIRQALAELDAQPDGRDEIEARQQAREAAGKKRRGRKPLPADPDKPWRVANKGDKKQRKVNLTDPTSRMLKAPSRFLQGYSCQAVTDRNQIILAGTVTNQQTDNHALTPMLTAARDHLTAAGIDPAGLRVALADAGYWNSDQIDQIETDLRIIALVSTHRERTTRSNKPAPTPDRPSLHKMHTRMQHPTAKDLYRARSATIEPIFGQRKTNRRLDRFLRRGLPAVNAEWTLEIIAHNLTKLWRATTDPAPQPALP